MSDILAFTAATAFALGLAAILTGIRNRLLGLSG